MLLHHARLHGEVPENLLFVLRSAAAGNASAPPAISGAELAGRQRQSNVTNLSRLIATSTADAAAGKAAALEAAVAAAAAARQSGLARGAAAVAAGKLSSQAAAGVGAPGGAQAATSGPGKQQPRSRRQQRRALRAQHL
jgi:hypothetical protein